MDDEELEKFLWIFALKNAVKHESVPQLGAIMKKIIGMFPELRNEAKKIKIKLDEIIPKIESIGHKERIKKLLKLNPEALKEEKAQEEELGLPPLPNVNNYEKVIMRLAPYPSGALHVGNARMIVLNDEYVKKYNGELILFFDDTIGSPRSLRNTPKAKYVLPEAYTLIEEGLEWLGVKYSKVYYKSDRLSIFYEYCEKLINDGLAYACFCDPGEFREKYKKTGKPCPHRDTSIKDNLEEWENMLSGQYQEMKLVIRLKTGMDQKDPALRDQIIMRISEAEHPRVGKKYIVWPMLEFSWAIDDYLIGVSHIVRGADLVKEDFIEDFIWEHFKWKKAEFTHYGRIKFPNMKLSKTEARNNIQNGIYEGWDDPRTWSLQSLKKRGIRPEALRKTLLEARLSMSGITFEVKKLYAKNQEIIDSISNRYFFVEDPFSVIIEKAPKILEEYIAEPLLLPSDPKKGKRIIKGVKNKKGQIIVFIDKSDAQKIKVGQIIRLKDLVNIQILSIIPNKKEIKAYWHSLELDREVDSDLKIIQWVPKEQNVKVSILKPDGTYSKGYGEINLLKIPMNIVIQFERYGFVNPIKLENKELKCYFTH
ncbi:MAG: glutamate--tRNA ligase [Promethearchaeota archaeon]